MIREYLTSLEKNYGYVGNWQPNCLLQIGDWSDVELGFLPWLKGFLGISYKNLEISKNLHSVMVNNLGNIRVIKEKRASFSLAQNVSFQMSESCNVVSIVAQKRGGFFAAFEDIQEFTADSASFRENLESLNKTAIAIVSGVTYVKKGILAVFSQESAALTLPVNTSLLSELMNNPSLINMDCKVSCESAGMAIYQAEPTKPIIPFLKIYIAEQDKKSQFGGRFARLGRNYDIMPFSYRDFFELYKNFNIHEES